MKKQFGWMLGILLIAGSAWAQRSTATATVAPYAGGTVTATFQPQGGGKPTVTQRSGAINGSGAFSLDVWDNLYSGYRPSVTQFTICAASPYQTTCYSNTAAVTGATDNVSSIFSSAPSPPSPGGGCADTLTLAASGGADPGATYNCAANLTADYHTVGAQQALTLTTIGSSGASALSGGVLNIPVYSGGSTVNVNGSPVSSPNFNGTTPAAPSNSQNASLQVSGSNVTIYLPNASGSAPGLMQADGSTITCVASTGVCTSNTGVSARIKYISQIPGIHQNGNLMASTGTDDTSLIEAVCNTATPSNIVILWQDGVSQITGLQCPTSGNWAIIGDGAGISAVNITNSTLTSGTVTFATTENDLVSGQYVQLEELTNCATLNNQTVQVSATGLTSTQFEATGLSGTCTSGAETARGTTLTGTGFFLADSSINSGIANWDSTSGISFGCYVNPTSALPASRGSNIILQNFALNGNRNGAAAGCHGIALRDVNDILEQNVIVYNTKLYANVYDNVGRLKVGQSTAYATNLSTANTDGYHVDGGSDHITISDIHCHTGDDCFALNAPEGYCAPISNVSVNGVSLDNSQDAFRMDADGTCPNGLPPTVSEVDIGHMEGTVYGPLGWVGNGGGAGSPDPGVFDVSIHDSKLVPTSTAFGAVGVLVTNATMNVTFADDTWVGPNWGNGGFWHLNSATPPTTHSLHIRNMTVEYTAAGSNFGSLLWNTIGATPTVPTGNVDVDGFQISHNGATGTAIPCLICNGSGPSSVLTANYVYYNNINSTSITAVINPADNAFTSPNITHLRGIGWGAPICDAGLGGCTTDVADLTGPVVIPGASSTVGDIYMGAFVLAARGYNIYCLNRANCDNTSYQGMFGGSTTDPDLYFNTPTAGVYHFNVNNVDVAAILPNGFSQPGLAGTGAICPNGTGNAFTQSGCTLPGLFTPFSTVYNVSSTRAWNNLGTSIYQNLTGKPMQVNGYGAGVTGGSTANIACKVDTVSPPVAFVVFNNTWSATVASGAEAFSFLVPNNSYYECATANDVSPSPVGWYETY